MCYNIQSSMSLFYGFEPLDPKPQQSEINKDYIDANFVRTLTLATKVTQLGDANYVKKTEHMKGTATGYIDMNNYKITQTSPPTGGSHLTNKKYNDASFVKKTGHMQGAATGDINMAIFKISQTSLPTNDYHLTNKKYINDNFVNNTNIAGKVTNIGDANYVKKTDHMKGTATGDIDMSTHKITHTTAPTNNGHLANKKYIDDNFVSDADVAGKVVLTGDTVYVKKTDHMKGTATGDIDMSTHEITYTSLPTNGSHLTNKKYIDGLTGNFVTNANVAGKVILTGDANYVKKTDLPKKVAQLGDANYVKKTEHMQGTATGDIDMSTHKMTHTAAPTNGNHLTNKKYIDGLTGNFVTNANVAGKVILTGDANYVKKTEHMQGTATGAISMNFYALKDVPTPTDKGDAISKEALEQIYLSNYLKKTDHMKGTATGDINMNNHEITQTTAPTNGSHLTNKKFIDANYVKKTEHMQGTATDNINMSTHIVTQSATPTNASHLTNKKYVDDSIKSKHMVISNRMWSYRGISKTAWSYPESHLSGYPTMPMMVPDNIQTYVEILGITFDGDTTIGNGVVLEFCIAREIIHPATKVINLGSFNLGDKYELSFSSGLTQSFFIGQKFTTPRTVTASSGVVFTRVFYIGVKQKSGTTLGGNEFVLSVDLSK